MVNEWKALERAGEWAGLEGTALEDYVVLVAEINNTAIADYDGFESYEQEYYDFLNQEVFSDERVVDALRSFGVEEETVEAFRTASVPVEETFHSEHLLDHSLNELVDLIMMLKLVERYTTKTNQEYIPSRYEFQKLLFLTNLNLKQTETGSIVNEGEFGLLETTGYRYSFTKRSSGPFSTGAYTDKHRLYASDLLDEDVLENEGTGEVAEHEHTYGIKLSLKGELLLNRFREVLQNFQTDILIYWNRAQEDAIDTFGDLSREEIHNYIVNETDIESRSTGKTLLPPRQTRFKSESDGGFDGITGVVNNV